MGRPGIQDRPGDGECGRLGDREIGISGETMRQEIAETGETGQSSGDGEKPEKNWERPAPREMRRLEDGTTIAPS